MSYADCIFKENCREILTHGVWDTDQNVRPHWEDGTPAHTVKKFGIVNRYNLRQEFPILTIRRTYFKTCIDELLWIWQQKSNNIHDLRGHIWDSWADENGSIGKAYGYQLAVKHQYPEGEMDQVVVERVGQADGGGGLALARGRGADGGDKDQLRLAGQLADLGKVELGLVLAVKLEVLLVDAGGSGDLSDGLHFVRLGDLNIGHVKVPPDTIC